MKTFITALILIFTAVFIGKNLTRPTMEQVQQDTRFLKALNFTRLAEGGYANNPNDPGGATNMGVTQNTYNAWLILQGKLPQDVKNITPAEVHKIFYENYWKAVGADTTASEALAIVMFDTAILCGVSKAKQLARQANYNVQNLLELRLAYHQQDINAQYFLVGWANRVNNLSDYVGA